MSQAVKSFFVPSAGNNYLPHFLHTKRAIFYSLVFVLVKLIVVVFTFFLPTTAFFLPDIVAAEQTKIIRLTNALRAQEGLGRLTEVAALDDSARLRAVDMASYQYFDHAGPYQRPLDFFIGQTGYNYEFAGENLSVGSFVAEEVFRAWEDSPGHYANLIDPDFSDIGFGIQTGVYHGQAVTYSALHLGRQAPILPTEANTLTPASLVSINKPVVVSVQATPILKYARAREVFSTSMHIFPVSQTIFLAALIIFTTVLLLCVFIEIRRQHYHIIAQTLAVIGLLVVLVIV